MLSELKILGHYAAALFEVVTMQSANPADKAGTFLPLEAFNRSAAKLSHIAFVLFRENGGAFVPPQHYYNTQIMTRTKYTSQGVGKIHYFFPYQESDNRLEC